MKRIISRPDPNQLPETPLPLYVRSVGYNEADAGWDEFFPASDKPFVQVFWSARGTGRLRIGDRDRLLPEKSVIYHLPGEDHCHTALTDWAYHWFTFDGSLAVPFIESFGYQQEPMHVGTCPSDLFLQLESLMREMTPYSQRKMLSIAMDILALAGESQKTASGLEADLADRVIGLIQECYSDPTTNVNELARALGVHRTTLNRLFKQRMQIAPGEYLMRLRIQTALSLLKGTDLQIHEVGERVGIPHRAYFCKVVRRTTGMTPKQYRESSLF